MRLPEPLLYGDKIPSLVIDEAKNFARKTLAEHEHCIEITDIRYSVAATKTRNSFEFLIRLFHAVGLGSCTHNMTYTLGSDQDAEVPDHTEPLVRAADNSGDRSTEHSASTLGSTDTQG